MKGAVIGHKGEEVREARLHSCCWPVASRSGQCCWEMLNCGTRGNFEGLEVPVEASTLDVNSL